MTSTRDAPADTNMMRIVHDALRRDLRRARAVLTREPPPDERQRAAAIAEHLAWLTAFLEAHHRSEDLGLYPVVRERDPGAAALLDEMARDHGPSPRRSWGSRPRPRPTPGTGRGRRGRRWSARSTR